MSACRFVFREDFDVATNPWWRRLLEGTRGRILAELRQGPATINELTERLAISANAARSHLSALERDRLVVADRVQRQAVGKPAHCYRLTVEANSLTPKAYDAMLEVVLVEARDRVGADGYAGILKGAAQRLAGDGAAGSAPFETRLADTQSFLAKIGANVEVTRAGNKVRLRGTDCPLASMVASHPELCGVLADVVARRLGVAVSDCCDRSAPLPRCCFEALVDAA
jgi:predicted ArsR family transcriptional regulator